ncbi:hypothetical protein ACUHMQ_18565, partial [Chitinimonas sp. PSY-7]
CLLKHGDDLAVRKSRFLHFVELPLSEKILLLHTPIFRGDYRGYAAKDWKTAMNQFAILYADRFIRSSV